MTRRPRRALARTLARPAPDLRWLALAAAALAGAYGLAAGSTPGAPPASALGR